MVARRQGKTRRNRTLSGLHILGTFAMQHGPWSDGRQEVTEDEMKQLYKENRDAFTAVRDPKGQRQPSDTFGHFPGKRSWCWWQVDAPEPRNREIPEVEQLDRLGLLTDEELRMLERDIGWPPGNEQHARLFDRPWSWWRFVSPDLRDWSISDPSQLVTMGRKHWTEREAAIIDTGIDPANQRFDSEDLEDIFTTEEMQRFNIPIGM